MKHLDAAGLCLALAALCVRGGDWTPASQHFFQETSVRFGTNDGLPPGPIQLVESVPENGVRVFASGRWYEFESARWKLQEPWSPGRPEEFTFVDGRGQVARAAVPWAEVRQVLRFGATNYLLTRRTLSVVVEEGRTLEVRPQGEMTLNQAALSKDGALYIASSRGLFEVQDDGWRRVEAVDRVGRSWAAGEVRGVGFDTQGRLWLATKAGVGYRAEDAWHFFEGKDGLPWNDFTGLCPGPDGEVWFGTRLGAIRFDGRTWQYRQGLRWLPHDEVAQVAVDADGRAWFATAGGLGAIERRPMTLAAKAELYEQEIERFVKRTPFGFVAEAHLRQAGDKTSADPQDSDNDGLWTAMYGAGECFAYGATHDPQAKERARKAFDALRFLQKVTQGCAHEPPKGYVARTVRPVDWPDPNAGRLERDRADQKEDKLWKAYEPRWPKSADGQWYWKSDTSSDELDGHYFFYPLYYDWCADTDAERDRVREVVRDLTDHLLTHGFVLIDHDGKPTRWGIYGPQFLNRDPFWWQERGLKSLSILCYLAVAEHVTGDAKYNAAARELIRREGYAHNAMYAKVQHGPGSGNQSDDEMAFMCYYGLLHCSKNEELKKLIRYSFHRYWVNEAPEMNPFFNFAYAAHNAQATVSSPFGDVSLAPWAGWQEEAIATLCGFPLDRLNWASRNSHRLDIVELPRVASRDLDIPDGFRRRGSRVNGKALPIENRHFNHWNNDPWQLDYHGNGDELAAGAVFLLPYYMGLYHGFIEKPE